MLAHTQAGSDEQHLLIEELNDLMQLEYGTIAAFQAAIDRLEAVRLRNRFASFKADHESCTRNLALLVRSLGGEPLAANDPALGQPSEHSFFAALVDDKDIFRIMRANAQLTAQKYATTLKKLRRCTAAGADTAHVLRRNLQSEQVQCEWIDAVIGDMS